MSKSLRQDMSSRNGPGWAKDMLLVAARETKVLVIRSFFEPFFIKPGPAFETRKNESLLIWLYFAFLILSRYKTVCLLSTIEMPLLYQVVDAYYFVERLLNSALSAIGLLNSALSAIGFSK